MREFDLLKLWKPITGLILGAFFLAGCTPSQLYATVETAAGAGKAYLGEQLMVRQEYRALGRTTVDAEYRAEMRAADEAERAGDMEKAKVHWAAARAVLARHMPTLKSAKETIGDFFGEPQADPGIAPHE